MRNRTRAALAVTCAAAISLTSALPALAEEIISIGTGTLVAKGAAADVPVTFICDQPSVSDSIGLLLTQKVGNGGLAIGSGNVFLTPEQCNGAPQTVVFRIFGFGGTRAYKKGVAAAEAFLTTCPPESNCTFIANSQVIKLR